MFINGSEAATLDVVHFRLAEHVGGNGLAATREQGEQARALVQLDLLTSGGRAPVEIDVHDLVGISWPFADSFFGLLLSGWLAGYYEGHSIVVFGANREVSETIDAALRLTKKNMGIVSIRPGSDPELLGGETALKDTIAAAAKLPPTFTASQLGVQLGVTPQAINNRLKSLVSVGALIRTSVTVAGGGREFEYELPQASLSESFASNER